MTSVLPPDALQPVGYDRIDHQEEHGGDQQAREPSRQRQPQTGHCRVAQELVHEMGGEKRGGNRHGQEHRDEDDDDKQHHECNAVLAHQTARRQAVDDTKALFDGYKEPRAKPGAEQQRDDRQGARTGGQPVQRWFDDPDGLVCGWESAIAPLLSRSGWPPSGRASQTDHSNAACGGLGLGLQQVERVPPCFFPASLLAAAGQRARDTLMRRASSARLSHALG
jgi:hypothetical protein